MTCRCGVLAPPLPFKMQWNREQRSYKPILPWPSNTKVDRVVSRAALRQRIWLCGFGALWPVASAQLTVLGLPGYTCLKSSMISWSQSSVGSVILSRIGPRIGIGVGGNPGFLSQASHFFRSQKSQHSAYCFHRSAISTACRFPPSAWHVLIPASMRCDHFLCRASF
jgi:hypothetical protein